MKTQILEHLTGDINNIPLDTIPPMTVGDVLDKTDGVYFCIKNRDSVFLWVNKNFADLVGQRQEDIIGTRDERTEHVAHDRAVMESGIPLLNFHETIEVPQPDGSMSALEIVTQKGLLRKKDGNEIIGITVCFSKRFPNADKEADELIRNLNMVPTGIGGYLAHGPISSIILPKEALPECFGGPRKAYSTNYFLLKKDEVLKIHALNQDEQWFFHQGSAIKLHIFSEDGVYSSITFGNRIDQEQFLMGAAPHSHWFGAEVIGSGYSLSSCSLAPAWDKDDSFLPDAGKIEELKRKFPKQVDIIERLR
ncbi:cupin domain-containing protein [Flavobacterium gelatinilyticum]|uniref:cupin domain-containing protein n=1 Tax=Flavobacterium gelatinilyticum TaxID=3003260 RepID=UPI0024801148|nr:cupin domain-containing protein [Flavobacterium gelatinilyticum]